MYEPSEEIKKQIAKENWDLELGNIAEDFKKASKATQGYYMKQANNWSNLPTIKKALELYEMIPDETKKLCRITINDKHQACPCIDYDSAGAFCSATSTDMEDRDYYGHFWLKCKGCPRPYKGEEERCLSS